MVDSGRDNYKTAGGGNVNGGLDIRRSSFPRNEGGFRPGIAFGHIMGCGGQCKWPEKDPCADKYCQAICSANPAARGRFMFHGVQLSSQTFIAQNEKNPFPRI